MRGDRLESQEWNSGEEQQAAISPTFIQYREYAREGPLMATGRTIQCLGYSEPWGGEKTPQHIKNFTFVWLSHFICTCVFSYYL